MTPEQRQKMQEMAQNMDPATLRAAQASMSNMDPSVMKAAMDNGQMERSMDQVPQLLPSHSPQSHSSGVRASQRRLPPPRL